MSESVSPVHYQKIPTIHIISDSVGATAQAMARAAAAQFGVTNPRIETLPKVKSFQEVRRFLDEHSRHHEEAFGDDHMLVFYTLVNTDVRNQVSAYVEKHDNIVAVDLMTNAVDAIAKMSGCLRLTCRVTCAFPITTTSAASRPSSSPSRMTTGATPRSSRRLTSSSSAFRDLRRRPFPSTSRSRATSGQHPARSFDRAAQRDLRRRSNAPVRPDDDR